MWKKDEEQSSPQHQALSTTSPPRVTSTTSGRATIGPSISIKGDVTGSEDLLIQGKVDGSITLDLHAVSVGSEGHVNANITGRVITVEGKVEGDLIAKEQVILRGTAQVQGDIKAPRVVLEDGATFRGLVDMGSHSKGGTEPAKASTSTKEESDKGQTGKGQTGDVTSKASGSGGPSRTSATPASSAKGRDASEAASGAQA